MDNGLIFPYRRTARPKEGRGKRIEPGFWQKVFGPPGLTAQVDGRQIRHHKDRGRNATRKGKSV